MSININKFFQILIDYYVSCHDGRILVDHTNYNYLNKKIILIFRYFETFSNIKTKRYIWTME